MTVERERLLGETVLGDIVPRLLRLVEPERIVPGRATVELDRAEADLRAATGRDDGARVEPVSPDVTLGATCRFVRLPADRDVVLLEPVTEGRLAAALARHGEGTVALYLVTDDAAVARAREAGFVLSATNDGPFGAQRLILTGPRDGPFLLLAGLDRPPPTSAP